MTGHIDIDAVRDALTIPDFLDGRGHGLRRSPNGWRGPCPVCDGSRQATKFSVRRDGQLAQCFACGVAGDVVKLAGELDGTDFPTTLRTLASIAGIARGERPSVEVQARRKAERIERQRAREAAEAADKRCGEQRNRARWAALRSRHSAGEAYLRDVRAIQLEPDGETFRFDEHGNVYVPVRSLDDGRIIDAQRRAIDPGVTPKVMSWGGAGSGCFGDVRHLELTSGPVVIAEGLTCYLTALDSFADNLPLGALGASMMARIVRELAPWLKERGLWICPDRDSAGRQALLAVRAIVEEVGIPESKIEVVHLDRGDLNDLAREVGNAA